MKITGSAQVPHTVGIRDLRQNLSKYVKRVKTGETLTVTEDGKQVAVLAPLVEKRDVVAKYVAAGKAAAPKDNLLTYLAEHPPVATTAGTSSSEELLDEIRADRL